MGVMVVVMMMVWVMVRGGWGGSGGLGTGARGEDRRCQGGTNGGGQVEGG